jgi:hypothetical protein
MYDELRRENGRKENGKRGNGREDTGYRRRETAGELHCIKFGGTLSIQTDLRIDFPDFI